MGKVFAEISMSLDGFIAGPNDGPELGLGAEGERLHEWVLKTESWRAQHGLSGGEPSRDSEVLAESVSNAGAVVIGRRMFDNAEGAWGDEPPFRVPVFVPTHRPRPALAKRGGTTFNFVSGGFASAVEQAQAAAGGKDISVGGGASVIQQAVQSGLLDELRLHLVPLLLDGGVRLFENLGAAPIDLELLKVVPSPLVTHLRYRVAQQAR